MKKRLQVILSHAGVASRRHAVEVIESGRVKVNGIVVREKGFRVEIGSDKVEFDGRIIKSEKKVYYILNKPYGLITTSNDEMGRTTVLDVIRDSSLRVYPVGRLDKDTEGLLILTNDGDLSFRLTHPKFGIKKAYIVSVEGHLNKRDMEILDKGIYLDGKKTAPCKFALIKPGKTKSGLRVELHEGRKRQIRRMLGSIDCRVLKLVRVEYAGIKLRSLRPGEYRRLNSKEIEELKNAAR